MTTMFIGGAVSSGLTGWIHSSWGWTGVMVFASTLQLLALVVWAVGSAGAVSRRHRLLR
jgi:cyanate permease